MTSRILCASFPKFAGLHAIRRGVSTNINKVKEEMGKSYAKNPAQTAAEMDQQGTNQAANRVKNEVLTEKPTGCGADKDKSNVRKSEGAACGEKKLNEEQIAKSSIGPSTGMQDQSKAGGTKKAPQPWY